MQARLILSAADPRVLKSLEVCHQQVIGCYRKDGEPNEELFNTLSFLHPQALLTVHHSNTLLFKDRTISPFQGFS